MQPALVCIRNHGQERVPAYNARQEHFKRSKNCKLLAGLGFPKVPGNMVPSKAVIVKRDVSGASGTPSCTCNVHLRGTRQQTWCSACSSTMRKRMQDKAISAYG